MNAPRTGREIFRPRRHLLMVAEPLDTPPERLLDEFGWVGFRGAISVTLCYPPPTH